MFSLIFSLALPLFLLMDPIGNIPIYLSILQALPQKRRLIIIFREMVFAFLIMMIFAFFGDNFLKWLGISHDSILLAGGIVLFVMALKMIFPEKNGSLADSFGVDGEPFIFPLAVPLVAGPSILAAIMIYSHQLESFSILFFAILFAWVASTVLLLLSSFLQSIIGMRGLKALERLMGMILMLIAVNMFVMGVDLFLQLHGNRT